MGQDSEYVDLHGGSRAYVYDHGSGIEGVGSYGEFIYAIYTHARLSGMVEDRLETLERKLENHYGEHSEPTKSVGPKPEMAHIVAQHLDSRLDGMELTDEDRERLQAWADEGFTECPECGEEWRPTPYTPDSQGERCRDCEAKRLRQMDVSADVSELREYLENEVPDEVPPSEFHDDEFYALAMEVFMEAEGEERQALHHQLGEASDEIMDAVVEERTVDKEYIRGILDEVDEDG